MKRKPKKFSWPFDASTTIALSALVVSLGQFALTTPAIVDLYIHPKIVVSNVKTNTKDPVIAFHVDNVGLTSAHDVEIEIKTYPGDKIVVTPNFGATITEDELKELHRIVVPYLSRREGFFVSVFPGAARTPTAPAQAYIGNGIVVEEGPFPYVTYARSASGQATIKARQFGEKKLYLNSKERLEADKAMNLSLPVQQPFGGE